MVALQFLTFSVTTQDVAAVKTSKYVYISDPTFVNSCKYIYVFVYNGVRELEVSCIIIIQEKKNDRM